MPPTTPAPQMVHDGRFVPYTPALVAVTAGGVIALGSHASNNLVGVAVNDIAVGERGALDTEGVHSVPKKDGDAMAAGTLVYWEGTNQEAQNAAAIPLGRVLIAAGSSDTHVTIKLGAR